jgi:hypothetical protein
MADTLDGRFVWVASMSVLVLVPLGLLEIGGSVSSDVKVRVR